MRLGEIICYQIDGFRWAGKTLERPQNQAELVTSRAIAIGLFVLILVASVSLLNSPHVPTHIYWRALILLLPVLGFVLEFWRGLSIRWIATGLRRYWLVPLWIVATFLVLMYAFTYLFADLKHNGLFYWIGLYLTGMGFVIVVYSMTTVKRLVRSAKSKPVTYRRLKIIGVTLFGLLFFAFGIGGLVSLAYGSGFSGWFLTHVLGW